MERELCGIVVDSETGEGLIAATVIELESKAGTVTDFDGKFCLSVPPGSKELIVTYIGYETLKLDLSTIEEGEELILKLNTAAVLDEVIINGSKFASGSSKRRTRKRKRPGASSDARVVKESITTKAASSRVESASYTMDSAAGAAGPAGPAGPTPPPGVDMPPAPEAYAGDAKKSKAAGRKAEIRDRRTTDEADAIAEDMMLRDAEEVTEEASTAGTLTAGELNDFSKWDLWQDLTERELSSFPDRWKFNMSDRYVVQLMSEDSRPLIDAEVKLVNDKNSTLWKAKTDNTGKAELWSSVFRPEQTEGLSIQVSYEGNLKTVKDIKKFKEGVNTISMDANCNVPRVLDVMMTVDATGSMGDEIAYLKAELQDVIAQVQAKQEDLTINLGSVFYRDTYDSYITKSSDFSTDINEAMDFMKEQSAGGGGDFPEAVDVALSESIEHQNWSENAVARIMFLVLDAPPHVNEKTLQTLEAQIKSAAAKGIRIIPIAASGIDKSTEYLMRSFSLATNGSYVFLTDHSGVGNAHIAPSTDDYDMEFLNDLLIRLITQYTEAPDCDEPQVKYKDDPEIQEEIGEAKIYPNPTNGPITIEVPKDVEELFITDTNGKVILRLTRLQKGKLMADLSGFPTGIYFVKFQQKDKEYSGKVAIFR